MSLYMCDSVMPRYTIITLLEPGTTGIQEQRGDKI